MNDAPVSLAGDLLHGADAAAQFLGLKRATVYRMVAAGTLPHIRKGRTVFFRKSELERAFRIGNSFAALKASAEPPKPKPSTEGTLTTAQVLPYFVEAFADGENGYTWMLARLHNLKKLWKMDTERLGRGTAFRFTGEHVWKMSLVLALGRLGIGPSKAIAHYERWGEQAPKPGQAGQWIIPGERSSLFVSTDWIAKLTTEMLPSLFPTADSQWPKMEDFMRSKGADENVIDITRQDYRRHGGVV